MRLTNDPETINKIIKIQSHVRGMEMRDKIKLRGRPKKSQRRKLDKQLQNDFSEQKIDNL